MHNKSLLLREAFFGKLLSESAYDPDNNGDDQDDQKDPNADAGLEYVADKFAAGGKKQNHHQKCRAKYQIFHDLRFSGCTNLQIRARALLTEFA